MLSNHTAVVTGGAAGIGREICRAFGEACGNVVVADLREEPSEDGPSVATLFESFNGDAHYIETDVTNETAVIELSEAATNLSTALIFSLTTLGLHDSGP